MRIQKAFVLIQVDAGHAKKVADKLMQFDEVREVHIIAGEWDLLLVIEAERDVVAPNDEMVLQVVLDKIDKVSHVRRSNTIIPSFSKFKA
ncbi:MAG: Lrp/AsnC ligand binding domain-containing protein [Thaumarchaeota archaeon]|nr:Lrp/AsnC ligand binding domain-containing protein [Nitrososphaerota archaeon]